MNRKLFFLLIVITTNANAQTADTMNLNLKNGTNIPYNLPLINGLTFSGVQAKDTMDVNLKTGLTVQYPISLLDSISFSNEQTSDSIFIELKEGDVQKYAISSISALSFIGWDESTSIETVKSDTDKGDNLGQNFPNPFNLTTTIQYNLPKRQNVSLTVFAMTGRMIVTLIQEQQSSGIHQITWDASAVPGGIYFYKMQAGEYMATKKMILLK